MAKNKKKTVLEVLVAILMLVVFSGFYFVMAPYVQDEVGEKDGTTEATVPAAATEAAARSVDKSSEYLILVNKSHGLGKNDEPKDLKLVKYRESGRESKYQKLRSVVAKAFNTMASAAKKQGCIIKVTSAYRPYSYQEQLYKKYVNKDGQFKAEQYSAKPGHSEHQTGLCADVSSPSVNYNLVQAYGTTEEGKWLAKNAHKYGFIIRYQKGKEKITGYEYEPWHIRYVGKEAATEIYKQKITLEEYLGAV